MRAVVDLTPWMSWMATLGAGCATVRAMGAEAELPWVSVTVTGREMAPEDVVVTVAVKEKTLLPLSVKAWFWMPPIRRRSPVTVMPVLAGDVAGVTVTVRMVCVPAIIDAGLAAPVAVRELEEPPKVELRGLGAATEKSVELLLVSVAGLARTSAVVLLGAGATAPSKQFAVPKPMKSRTVALGMGHAPARAVALLTRATLPVVAERLKLVPGIVASGVGRLAKVPVPAAAWIR